MDEKIEKGLRDAKIEIGDKSKKIKKSVSDFLSELVERSDNFIFALYLLCFFITIFVAYTFNPYNITSSAPIFFLFLWVIVFFLSCFFYAIYKTDDLNFFVLPLYAGEFAYGAGYIGIMLAIFCVLFFVTKRLLVHSTMTSVIITSFLFVLVLSVFYNFNSNKINKFKNENSSPFISFFFNLLYLIPCFLIDAYDFVVKDIKQAPSSTFALVGMISIILLLYYIFPLIQKMKIKDKDAISFIDKATELNRVVVSLTQKELKEKQIENKSYTKRQMLKLTQEFKDKMNNSKNTISENGSTFTDQLKKRKVYTHNDNGNISLNFTLLKDLPICQTADVKCTDGKIHCDTTPVQNDIGMFEKCNEEKETSFLGKLFTKRETTMDPNYHIDFFRRDDELMTFYSDADKHKPQSFREFCKQNADGASTITCVDFSRDLSGIVRDAFYEDNSGTLDSSGTLHGMSSVFACDIINNSPDENKYKIIHGFSDVSNIKTAFQCKNKQVKEKYTLPEHETMFDINTYVDISRFADDNGNIYTGRAVIRKSYPDGTYKVEMIGGPILNNVPHELVSDPNVEGFTGISTHNPDLHRLDHNIQTLEFLGWATPEERNLIEKTLENANIDITDKVNNLVDFSDVLLPSDMRERNLYQDILDNIYTLNLGNNSYLGDETSKLIEIVNRANHIYDINYYYGLSFWVYFDTEILKRGHGIGMILDMTESHQLYYNYSSKELIFTLHNCTKTDDVLDCSYEIVYKTSKISFQRWNHFVVNYSHGTLDLFVNNNLVMTKKNVAPKTIETQDQTKIRFGHADHTLDNCGLCNVQYFEKPMTIEQIDSLYSKKNNPCK